MPNTVADVSIALEIDEIEKAVDKRASVVSKLEHAYNVLKYKGVRPKHKVKICGKEKVDSIDFYENQLEEYNTQISAFITKAVEYQEKAHDESMDDDDDDTKKKNKLGLVTALPSRVVHGVLGKDDINTRSGAFITFNNLKSSMAARQMVHYKIPFIMSTVPAPAVKDVYWSNVDASLFAKLALFFIIQTFFVSAIAGSLFTSLQQLVDNPAGTIRDILATNLPQQANFFIAFVFVQIGTVHNIGYKIITRS
ncbi:hypothetical protein Pmar_PMAR027020 [Perkinsus marinus ATCC 50983]|uniref:CSC1/OSCA1-like cytosolic domain-containing protein n=1 Tax=Perkinsus marinus (strain ATCC 50983 / TXsc) TaxID=423536 RepID=C5LP33_PERM5|nr:hypothetical protein Pmar_PMAR027020 [Perkinsus marinus ATCC 50983]EER01514.1 hypothetical protein Pmar_PMAR027020 [Perkinsus marinus ATCC 50983]|eukprot:XP_002768796.1 hypothetical protein Pmar_PMAR027020 [Perkinsus marinus ATCC 50983]